MKSKASKNIDRLYRLIEEIEKGGDENSPINLVLAEAVLKLSSESSKQAMLEFRYRKESGYDDTKIDYFERGEDDE